MKKILFISLIISHLAVGQSITITPNDSALFDAKGTSNQLLMKNDTLKMTNGVFAIKNTTEIIDQQNSTNSETSYPIDFAGETFTAGMSGKLSKIDLKFNGVNNFVVLILAGNAETSEHQTILGRKAFTSQDGWFSVIIDTPISITSGKIYSFIVQPYGSVPLSVGWYYTVGNLYSGGISSIDGDSDFLFKIYCKSDYNLLVNPAGNVSAGGVFYGNGSGLTNLNAANLVGNFPSNITTQGNDFNSANKLLKLDASAQIPVTSLPSNITMQGNTFNGANQLLQLDATGNMNLNSTQTIFPINLRANAAIDIQEPVFAIENNANVPSWHLTLTNGNDLNFVESGVSDYRLFLQKGGNIGIGTNNPLERLEVVGNVKGTAFVNSSDIRFKKDFSKIENPLAKILSINGLYYHWRKDEFPNRGFDDKKQVGFIAQDLEKIFPEVVFTDKEGFKSVDYPKLTPLLVEAMKELKIQNDELRLKNEKLESSFLALKGEVISIKNLLSQTQNGK